MLYLLCPLRRLSLLLLHNSRIHAVGLNDLLFSLIAYSLNQASALSDPFLFCVLSSFFLFSLFSFVFFEVRQGHSVLMRVNENSLCDS